MAMQNDLKVSLTFAVEDAAGNVTSEVTVKWPGQNWEDVLTLEKMLIPAVMNAMFDAGQAYVNALKSG